MTLKKRFNPMLVRFSFSFLFFLGSFCFARPRFILFHSSMGSVDCFAWFVFAFVPDRFLGRCVLEGLMDSIDHDNGDDWD